MSNEAKLVYIQEKMRETKRRERTAYVGAILGMGLAVVGFVLSDPRFLSTSGIVLGVIGIIGAVIEAISYAVNMQRYDKLVDELGTMAKAIPTCPKCGKEIPKGNYTFCPFCGSPLIPPPP